MFFSSWLRKWKRSASTARWRTRKSPRQRAGFRPQLEALEDRWLPSSGGLHGHGGGHSGGGSGGSGSGGGLPFPTASRVRQLISDINYANTAGGAITINLKAGVTFDLTSADNTTDGGNELPVITGNITIVGNGDTIERVATYDRYGNPTNSYRLFDVALGASLTLEDVTLQDGVAGEGGAIYNQGTLTVSNNSALSGNSAAQGGGIYNAGGMVAINNSTLSGNGATEGGGFYNAGGTVAINNSTVSGNSAYYGGGIYNAGGMVTVSNNSTLSGNQALGITPGYSLPTVGYGGGVYNSSGTMAIDHSTLSDNAANFGGGIYIDSGNVTVSNSNALSGNTAYYFYYDGGLGGGIYVNGGSLTLSNSTLSGNTATDDGGGIYINSGGTVTVENDSRITGNTAVLGADVYNLGVLYLDSTSTIDSLDGNLAKPL